jgi:hypothetical protein
MGSPGARPTGLVADGRQPNVARRYRIPTMLGGSLMDTPATYVQLGFLVISVPNLLVILAMVAIFVAALVAPFPGGHGIEEDGDDRPE